MMKPLVTIIIPLYNSGLYIKDCIESCLSQTYRNVEILVIDDGSTDGGLGIAKNVSKEDERVKVFHKKNGGVSSARNMGISKSKGKLICFLDADDKIDKKYVDTIVNYMNTCNADFCFSKNIIGEASHFKAGQRKISSSDAEYALLSMDIKVGCWNKMYRKDILRNIKFREDLFYGEGLYFICQVAHNANNIIVCEDPLYYYRKVNPESATAKFNIEKMINGEKSLIEIRKIICKDGRKVNRMWAQHYCVFCMNAMSGLLDAGDDNYRKWKQKMRKYMPMALLCGKKVKVKIGILLAYISPKLFHKIKR